MSGNQTLVDIRIAALYHAAKESSRLEQKRLYGFDTRPTGMGRQLRWVKNDAEDYCTVGRYTMVVYRVPAKRALYNWHITRQDDRLGRCKVADGWRGELDYDVPIEEAMDDVFEELLTIMSDTNRS